MSCFDDGNCGAVQIEYDGNGSIKTFMFPFPYESQEEVHVEKWDPVNYRYNRIDRDQWSFHELTEVEFVTAPDYTFRIMRETDLSEMEVTFFPGSSIRAQDLNTNFEQLQHAIQEGWCRVSDEFYCYLDEFIFDKRDAWTKEEQQSGQVDPKGEKIFFDDAITARHDTYLQDNTPAQPTYEQGGKRWYDTNIPMNYIWNDQIEAWVDYSRMGPQGPRGADGHHIVLMGPTPPKKRPNGQPIQDGDIWFNTCIGEVYIYYDGQWITLAAGGPRGEQGEQGPEGPEGPASVVPGPEGPQGDTGTYQTICSLTAPKTRVDETPLQCGDIWFNTCKGEAFIYYDGKWLSFGSGGSKGEPGIPGSQVWVGTRPPDDRELFPLWVNTDCPNTGLYFYDGDYWVAASIPGPAGPAGQDGDLTDAPSDGNQYARQDGTWTVVTGGGGDSNLTFIAPLQKDDDTDEVSFSWSSINELPD